MKQPEINLKVKDLHAIEDRLNRGFYAAVIALLIYLALAAYGSSFLDTASPLAVWILIIILVSFLFAVAGYIWYVVSIARTTRALGKSSALYILWLLLAPILSLAPIPVISLIIGVSPLIIKFIISSEIRARIRSQTLRDLH